MTKKLLVISLQIILVIVFLFGCDGTGSGDNLAAWTDDNTSAEVSTAQASRPVDTVYSSNFSSVGARSLHEATDLTLSVDDGIHIITNGDAEAEFLMDSISLPVESSSERAASSQGESHQSENATLNFRAAGDRPGKGQTDAKITVEVYHGDYLVATSGPKALSDGAGFEDYSFSMTLYELDEAGDAAIRVRVVISGLNPDKGDSARISKLELEVPDHRPEEFKNGHWVTEDLLAIETLPRALFRMAMGPNGRIYVTDPIRNSVYIFEADMSCLLGQLKGLALPYGVAVDDEENIYVGNYLTKNIEKYSPTGKKLLTFGHEVIMMPNALTLDRWGNLYVVDSIMNRVWVFDPFGAHVGAIGGPGEGDGELRFPVDLAIFENDDLNDELYVADQKHYKIQVYDLNGRFLRSFGKELKDPPSGASGDMGMGGGGGEEPQEAKFIKIQPIIFDPTGRLHVLDMLTHKIQVLDRMDGTSLEMYGERGSGSGQILNPHDLLLNSFDQILVANTGNLRIDVIYEMTP